MMTISSLNIRMALLKIQQYILHEFFVSIILLPKTTYSCAFLKEHECIKFPFFFWCKGKKRTILYPEVTDPHRGQEYCWRTSVHVKPKFPKPSATENWLGCEADDSPAFKDFIFLKCVLDSHKWKMSEINYRRWVLEPCNVVAWLSSSSYASCHKLSRLDKQMWWCKLHYFHNALPQSICKAIRRWVGNMVWIPNNDKQNTTKDVQECTLE